MPDAWDTTVASRIARGRPSCTALLAAHLRARRARSRCRPRLSRRSALGIALRSARPDNTGRHSRAGPAPRALLAHPVVEVHAARRGRARRSRAGCWHCCRTRRRCPRAGRGRARRQRAAWALDVQIAACAFAGGYGVLTENVADFAVLRDAIEKLVPAVPPLVVTTRASSAAAPA